MPAFTKRLSHSDRLLRFGWCSVCTTAIVLWRCRQQGPTARELLAAGCVIVRAVSSNAPFALPGTGNFPVMRLLFLWPRVQVLLACR